MARGPRPDRLTAHDIVETYILDGNEITAIDTSGTAATTREP
jgi:hypothetical protein